MVEQAAGNFGKATTLRNLARERKSNQYIARYTIGKVEGTLTGFEADSQTQTLAAPLLQGS